MDSALIAIGWLLPKTQWLITLKTTDGFEYRDA